METKLNDKNQLILNAENWAAIVKVNNAINLNVRYKTDMEIYNKPDFWDVVERFGDCDDYAITKRHNLLLQGFPKPPLRIALCYVEGPQGPGTGGYHAVLMVETDRGTYVLDNRYAKVMYYKDLPYKFDRIQYNNIAWQKFVN